MWCCVAVASANPAVTWPTEETPGDDLPLAIPGGEPPPLPPGHRPQHEPPPLRSARLDEAYGQAIAAYRDGRIVLKSYDTLSYGTTGWVGYGYGYPGWGGWGFGGWPTVWVEQQHRLAVYEGSRRLDVPGTLRALDDEDGARDLDRRIRRNHTASTISSAVGVGGLLASLCGLVGSQSALEPGVRDAWSITAFAGAGVMVGGFVVAGFPGNRAERLRYDPTAWFASGELEDAVRDHNAALADSLGLSPADTARLEER